MISAFKFIKPVVSALPVLAIAGLISAGQASAQAFTAVQPLTQADAHVAAQAHTSPPYADAVPMDMMRGAGKWIGNLSFNDIAPDTTPAQQATAPAPLHFKPATPGWIHALDAASYLMTLTAPITFDILPSDNRPPPPNIQSPLK